MVDLVRQEVVNSATTIVIKIGTNVLAQPDGTLNRPHLARLTEQIAEIRAHGREVAIVSSGAIGSGMGRLRLERRPTTLPALQAAAAIGQCDLMNAYDECLRKHGYHAAQLLLTAEDFNDRARYLNMRNTIGQLFKWNAIPVINENDTVSVAEIRFGDNDQLAAMVANLLRAPLLVILSNVDGLYAGDPSADANLKPLDTVLELDQATLGLAGTSTSGLGTGGMRSKLIAVQNAIAAGGSVWIANGRQPDVLRRVLRGEKLGTLFVARGECLASWKRWIGYTARPRGVYVVDSGAEEALCKQGRSLLPVGVVNIHGSFAPGDVVAIANPTGHQFARGLTNYSSDEAHVIMGKPTSEVANLLAGARYEELIHRDNLVLL